MFYQLKEICGKPATPVAASVHAMGSNLETKAETLGTIDFNGKSKEKDIRKILVTYIKLLLDNDSDDGIIRQHVDNLLKTNEFKSHIDYCNNFLSIIRENYLMNNEPGYESVIENLDTEYPLENPREQDKA